MPARLAPEHLLQHVEGEGGVEDQGLPVGAEAQGVDGLSEEGHEEGGQEEPLAVPALVEAIGWRGPLGQASRQAGLVEDHDHAAHLRHAMQAADGHRLALPGGAALVEGRAHGPRRHHRLAIPANGQDQVDGAVPVGALPEGDAGGRRQQAVARRHAAPTAPGPVGRHPDMDQVGGALPQAGGVQAQGLQVPGRMVEDGDVRGPGQVPRPHPIGLVREVEDHDGLVPVPGRIAGMVLQPVAAGGFDLDDLGLKVAQQHAGHWPGDALREVGDAHALVGSHAPSPSSSVERKVGESGPAGKPSAARLRA